jgi:hypothetical protein
MKGLLIFVFITIVLVLSFLLLVNSDVATDLRIHIGWAIAGVIYGIIQWLNLRDRQREEVIEEVDEVEEQ